MNRERITNRVTPASGGCEKPHFRAPRFCLPEICILGMAFILCCSLSAFAQEKPVSYYHDLVPILKRSCTGCHNPGKLKGDLDLTTYDALKKGGKHGESFSASDPKKGTLLESIFGDEPDMPKEGDPLTQAEVAAFERWIAEGASDDTPEAAKNPFKLAKPPEYHAPPVISAMAFSPDGKMLAVSGYHEVLLHKPDGSGLVARLLGESPRIESLAFSSDGKQLMVAGGAPARFGEIQIWDVTTQQQLRSFKISPDSLYGATFSPDGKKIAMGAADRAVRVISAEDGKELLKFDNHGDWTFGAVFTRDGKRIVSCSRDKAMKLINVSNGQFIDDVNKLLEEILCFARNPMDDVVAYGGELGTPRIYRISDNQNRGGGNTARDANLLRELERQPSPVHAVAWSPDGARVVVGTSGESRIYSAADGKRTAVLTGNDGAVFALAFHPSNNQVATGGFDGMVRIFDSASGNLVTNFIPVNIVAAKQVAGGSNDLSER